MRVLIPLNKKVIIEPEQKEKQTQGGIVIPETANQKAPTKGIIISIAEDSEIRKKVGVGDEVIFSKYSGVEISIAPMEFSKAEKKYLIVKDEDILAVLKKKDTIN